jgi:hypothetical protein
MPCYYFFSSFSSLIHDFNIYLIFFCFGHRTTTSSSNKSTPSNFTTTKSLAHYNFLHSNQINDTTSHRSNTFTMTSDVGETTSTDSDIGTSPSGTTLASPPSSPQQQQNKSIQKFPNTLQPSPSTSSIIRHHSYLNAVQLNDFKLNQQMKSKYFNFFSFFFI